MYSLIDNNSTAIGRKVFQILRRTYKINLKDFIAPRIKEKSLYEFIVAVILSQNTSDRNAIKAYENLKKICNGSIEPDKIVKLDKTTLANAIKVAGMHNQRARVIKELANIFSNKDFVNKLVNNINNLNIEDARRELKKLPGIGDKTADIVLLMYFNKYTFPVDTHIKRITWRLGLVNRNDYDSIRLFWMKSLKPSDYLEAHLLLITHGRRICVARNPLCNRCPIRRYCLFYLNKKKQ